jgi:hypothetical protein
VHNIEACPLLPEGIPVGDVGDQGEWPATGRLGHSEKIGNDRTSCAVRRPRLLSAGSGECA